MFILVGTGAGLVMAASPWQRCLLVSPAKAGAASPFYSEPTLLPIV